MVASSTSAMGKRKKRKKRKKALKEGPQLKGRRRPERLANAREWLSAYDSTDNVHDFVLRYGVDRRCAILELRELGALSEAQEAEFRSALARAAQARAEKRARKRAQRARAEKNRAEKKRAKKARAKQKRAAQAHAAKLRLDRRREAENGAISMAEAYADEPPEGDWNLPEEHWPLEERWPLEEMLLDDARALALKVTERTIENLEDHRVHVRMTIEADPAVLARCVWGLMFAISALSFRDADLDFARRDNWTPGDMLRCLSFERGRLRFHADRVRGRCMMTTIEIDPESRITLETVNRGEAALGWISRFEANDPLLGVENNQLQEIEEEIPF
jgi:hypothetical protein